MLLCRAGRQNHHRLPSDGVVHLGPGQPVVSVLLRLVDRGPHAMSFLLSSTAPAGRPSRIWCSALSLAQHDRTGVADMRTSRLCDSRVLTAECHVSPLPIVSFMDR